MPRQSIKPFLTYSQQLTKLTKDKKLLIPDSVSAKNAITNISYYSLIGGYKQLFYNPMTRQYLPGTTFDDLLQLYYFDESLRALFFKYLCHIEQKMRSFLKTNVQAKISIHFNGVNERELGQYLKALTYYRNVCAHNERLYSFRCRVDIPDTLLHEKLNIPQRGKQYTLGKSDLFAVVISFRYLLSGSEFIEFKKQITKLINTILSNSHTLTEPMLLNAMGFPENWKKITRYKL